LLHTPFGITSTEDAFSKALAKGDSLGLWIKSEMSKFCGFDKKHT
jgi:hypothetical protein